MGLFWGWVISEESPFPTYGELRRESPGRPKGDSQKAGAGIPVALFLVLAILRTWYRPEILNPIIAPDTVDVIDVQ